MMMYCTGSKEKDLIPSGVAVDVDIYPAVMQHHKHVLIDDRVAIRGSVNFSYHAMVSAGILAIHADVRVRTPLARDFSKIRDLKNYQRVTERELVKRQPCLRACQSS